MKRIATTVFTAWLAVTGLVAPVFALEPWADPKLPITGGLEIWLDATRLNAARKAHKQPELGNGQKVDTWLDASGHRRHLIQKDATAQPAYHVYEDRPAIRFDGERQFLSQSGLKQSFRNVTVFIVATPFANRGDFRGFLAMNQAGKSDFVTGLNIDQGKAMTLRMQWLNVEGAGFSGARRLGGPATFSQEGPELGRVYQLCVTSVVGPNGTRLYLNGKLEGQRDRTDSVIHMDQLTLGARFFGMGGSPTFNGFFEGDLAEVLIYSRHLTEAERMKVTKYLAVKHAQGRKVPDPKRPMIGKPLVSIPKPPPVQVFVPGFTVKELPVDLTNVNNVLYRPDGKLVALTYDGDVYLLSDSKGTGVEDKAELFWENKGRIRAPIGMDLTPPNYKHGNGLFIAAKGKCSLIVDSNGDGKADKEIIVAQGWEELPHGVDALGVAVDPRDHSIYFGLGCASYTNPYLIGKDGKARYSLKSERGTIMRVAPDFKSREIICTGIRFPVGIRFNKAGDLFCTDQEGATWLFNGNPFDELLHIEKGRHYGFPPRHPKHLPHVIDEPSLFDYGPQHQSTCGLNFNEPVNGGPVFGPAWWQSDVIITGYSRGKLYRTRIVKTAGGYVAQNQLIASLNMLPVDACISPGGDLIVAVHSGGPDWGSGPKGKGKLYKISYTGKDLPQPVAIWPQGPRELRIAFDRPLNPEHLPRPSPRLFIEHGKYVGTGDRFEFHRPGYQAVQDQLRTPRFELPIHNIQITNDRRTLILATAPHTEAGGYAITLPGLGRPSKSQATTGELPQLAETDLGYDLSGVEVAWQAKDGGPKWTGWLPHLDLTAAKKFTSNSTAHEELWAKFRQQGKLTLRTQLKLRDMLRPEVQPGSKLDYELPPERVTLTFRSNCGFQVKTPQGMAATKQERGATVAVVTIDKPSHIPVPVEIILDTHATDPDLSLTYHTNEDARPRAMPLHRLLLPWATIRKEVVPQLVEREIPEIKGGSWERGQKIFFGEQGTCFKCHSIYGEGGTIGPDLSNLTQRDYASVLRDIEEPSYTLHPDYITQVIALKNGKVIQGVVQTEGDLLRVGDIEGKVTIIRRDEIDTMEASPISTMPEGLHKQIGPTGMKDLMTFLLTQPPRLTDYGKRTPPPPRSLKEVNAVLAGAPHPPAKSRPLHVVLVAGQKDHGPGEHDYPAWQRAWSRLLRLAENVKVSTAMDWPVAADLKSADVLVFYQRGKWNPERARDVDAFLARGGGLVYIHYAVDGGTDAPGFAQRIGLAWQSKQSRFRHGPLELGFHTGARHPIARNFERLHLHDESYWNLIGDAKRINLVATGVEQNQAHPLFWTLEPSKGRVFVSIPGHYSWTFDDPLFRVLLLRGIAWTAREPVDRFNDIVTVGARVKE